LTRRGVSGKQVAMKKVELVANESQQKVVEEAANESQQKEVE